MNEIEREIVQNIPALKICRRCLELKEGEADQNRLNDVNPDLAVYISWLSPLIEKHSVCQEHGLRYEGGAELVSLFGFVPSKCLCFDSRHGRLHLLRFRRVFPRCCPS